MIVIIIQYAHTVISCRIISYIVLLIIEILYLVITIYFVLLVVTPFREDPTPLPSPSSLPTIHLSIYLPTNLPTNQSTYLLTRSTLYMPA